MPSNKNRNNKQISKPRPGTQTGAKTNTRNQNTPKPYKQTQAFLPNPPHPIASITALTGRRRYTKHRQNNQPIPTTINIPIKPSKQSNNESPNSTQNQPTHPTTQNQNLSPQLNAVSDKFNQQPTAQQPTKPFEAPINHSNTSFPPPQQVPMTFAPPTHLVVPQPPMPIPTPPPYNPFYPPIPIQPHWQQPPVSLPPPVFLGHIPTQPHWQPPHPLPPPSLIPLPPPMVVPPYLPTPYTYYPPLPGSIPTTPPANQSPYLPAPMTLTQPPPPPQQVPLIPQLQHFQDMLLQANPQPPPFKQATPRLQPLPPDSTTPPTPPPLTPTQPNATTQPPTPPPAPKFTTPLTLILRYLPGLSITTVQKHFLQSAVLTFTPFSVKRYPARRDSFTFTMEQSHATILHHTLCGAIHNLYRLHSNPPTKPTRSALPPPQVELTLAMDRRDPSTESNCPPPSLETHPFNTYPWKTVQAPQTVPTPLHHDLLGIHAPTETHWWSHPLPWFPIRSTLSYGLCWHLALLAKALATAWDLINQTRLWDLYMQL